MTREPASAGSDTKTTGDPKHCTTPCRFAPCDCCGPGQRRAYTREWVIPGCSDGPEGNLQPYLTLRRSGRSELLAGPKQSGGRRSR